MDKSIVSPFFLTHDVDVRRILEYINKTVSNDLVTDQWQVSLTIQNPDNK